MPKVEQELDRLIENGILTKVETNDRATPIVPITYTMDIDQYPLPKVEDIFASLGGGEKFTKLDLKNVYFQIKVRKVEYLTINTHKGLLLYNRLVFGISSAPAIWLQTVEQILQGLDCVKCILDDMIITGKRNEDHLADLDQVPERVDKYGLRLNVAKCAFLA